MRQPTPLMPDPDNLARGLGRWSLAGAATLVAVAAVVVVVLAASGRQVLLPVVAFLSAPGTQAFAERGSSQTSAVQIATVDLGAAIVVLCLLVAVCLVVTGWRLRASSATSGVHTARWIEYSLTSSITVFLVAQINGITDITTLVLVYAATTGAALFGLLSDRTRVTAGHPRLALCFQAGLGIVPWGVIAFQQVGSGLAGLPPTAAVRVITLIMLAFAAALAVAEWRSRGARTHTVLTVAATAVFSATVLLGVILPG